ncbi:MAG: N-acetylmuramoyl-L-alanine amidase [Oculatellaceae cyanobacterium Prado106]|jgi:N-acetylmuramoyl-L-alanine amidase|nr:N-acetylmuramoyl-L-alanine amidase [Oculatellaceae cyanobacterium Prado106]
MKVLNLHSVALGLLGSLISLATVGTLSAEAANVTAWQFNPGGNRLEFTTDTAVQPRAQWLVDTSQLVIDLPGTETRYAIQNFNGVIHTVEVTQYDTLTTRITVELAPGYSLNPQQIQFQSVSPTQWVVQLPEPVPQAAENRVPAPVSGDLATLQAIAFSPDGRQLLIQSDRPVTSSGQWRNGQYQILIPDARLARGLTSIPLPAEGSVLQARLRQSAQGVTLSLLPRTGIRFGVATQVSSQELAIAIESSSSQSGRTVAQTSNRSPARPVPQGRVVVAIDPGHGGRDPGAVGIDNIHESEVVLDVAQQVAQLLDQQGIQAVLTRNSDEEIDLQPRVDTAEQARANLFVSIHANALSMERPDANGVSTYYFSNSDLAQTLQDSAVAATGMNDRGIHAARFYVIRNTSMPSALIEIGFVTGAEDEPRLASPQWRTQMAGAIANGILQYVQRHSMTSNR